MRKAGVGEANLSLTWDDWDTSRFDDAVVMKEVAEKFITGHLLSDSGDVMPWLIYWGPVGVGKTMILSLICRYLIERAEESVLYYTTADLLRKVKSTFGDQKANAKFIKALRDVDVLILDDFGAEQSTEYNRSELLALIDWRYANGKRMVLSSNVDPEKLRESAERTHSRLLHAGRSRVIGIDAESQRVSRE